MKLGKGKKIYAIRLIFLYFNLAGNFLFFISTIAISILFFLGTKS